MVEVYTISFKISVNFYNSNDLFLEKLYFGRNSNFLLYSIRDGPN